MTAPDYKLFDNALLTKIREGKRHFSEISSGRLLEFADKSIPRDKRAGAQGWRLIDRRLQALRKKGVLSYDRVNGWRIA
jgi:hypothetical protein